jgi:hypothetical protein
VESRLNGVDGDIMKPKNLKDTLDDLEHKAIRLAGFISMLLFLYGYLAHEAKVI